MRHQIKYFSPMHFEIWSVEICSGGGSFEICCSAMLHSSAWAVLELTPSFLFQIPHVHHVRAFINQPVRTDQEEQVPGLFSAACAKVCTQPAPVSGHSVQKQNNPLWYEAGERATQAAGSLWHQGKISVLYACLSTLWNQSPRKNQGQRNNFYSVPTRIQAWNLERPEEVAWRLDGCCRGTQFKWWQLLLFCPPCPLTVVAS